MRLNLYSVFKIELIRWTLQIIMIFGAIPYTLFLLLFFSPLESVRDHGSVFIKTIVSIGYVIFLTMWLYYYYLSFKIHYIRDIKKNIFNKNIFRSVRLYFFIIGGLFLLISLETKFIKTHENNEFVKTITNYSLHIFIFYSVIFTWYLSEIACRTIKIRRKLRVKSIRLCKHVYAKTVNKFSKQSCPVQPSN